MPQMQTQPIVISIKSYVSASEVTHSPELYETTTEEAFQTILCNQGLAVSIATEDGSSTGYYRAITINSSLFLPQFNEASLRSKELATTDKFLALCKPDGIVMGMV